MCNCPRQLSFIIYGMVFCYGFLTVLSDSSVWFDYVPRLERGEEFGYLGRRSVALTRDKRSLSLVQNEALPFTRAGIGVF